MDASSSLSLKRSHGYIGNEEEQPTKRVKFTKRERSPFSPPKAPISPRKVAPSKPLRFTSSRVNNTTDTVPTNHLSDNLDTYTPLPRLANGGRIVDPVAQDTQSPASSEFLISEGREDPAVVLLLQQKDAEIAALKAKLEESEKLRLEGALREEHLREQARGKEEFLRRPEVDIRPEFAAAMKRKIRSKGARVKKYKQKYMDSCARHDDLEEKMYQLEQKYEMVKDRGASYVLFEGRKTPFFISHNYGEPNITTEELAAIQKAADDEEVAEIEDYLADVVKECDILIDSIEKDADSITPAPTPAPAPLPAPLSAPLPATLPAPLPVPLPPSAPAPAAVAIPAPVKKGRWDFNLTAKQAGYVYNPRRSMINLTSRFAPEDSEGSEYSEDSE
ncbi:hypothetical protein NHQ30_000444 [Ciborinia camelliae]|nr:hypothetical protein NHQ30_000444 [Ciborinia camelliae]